MKLGDLTITMVNGGGFRLDGGTMHGVVPKTLWSRLVSCDDKNRVAYSTNCLLVETAGQRVLIETGNGDKFPAKEREIYGIDHDRSVAVALRELGVEPASIDLVVMTHLHFDHSGGTTRRTASGGYEPVFPRARHIIQRGELESARHAHERNRASYLPENFEPLAEAGLLDVVQGEVEIAPSVRVLPTPGHTPHHQSVLVGAAGGPRALFLGDVVPTALHVRLPFIMAFDLDVEATLRSKKSLLSRAVAEDWLVLFGHDLEHAARLKLDARGQAEVAERVQVV
jgi:glyoxylase-like metal-dependent hydrolase (beta-lactamase superfamily II)